MSVTMAKSDGVTVFTIQSDPQSRWPPVCQILKNLCYSPWCCSVSQQLRKIHGTSNSILGAIQIMIGLLNIGFGVILRRSPATDWQMNKLEFPYWLGGLFITFGVMCVLSELFPSFCLVILHVIMSLAGVGVAIAAIVLYSIYISRLDFRPWHCFSRSRYYYTTTTASPAESEFFSQMCLEGKLVIVVILRGINVLLIVLSVLELCTIIGSVVIGIKTLWKSGKDENRSSEDLTITKPLVGDVAIHPTV